MPVGEEAVVLVVVVQLIVVAAVEAAAVAPYERVSRWMVVASAHSNSGSEQQKCC